ncbi:MAG: hypothetical protein ACI857_000837 [Arenicella sp.]|jgi:hypothetical protein
MKPIYQFFLFSFLVSSCQFSGNFNKQKFTNLKHLSSKKDKANSIEKEETDQVLSAGPIADDSERFLFTDTLSKPTGPYSKQIEKAIKERKQIFVQVKGGEHFQLVDPTLDDEGNLVGSAFICSKPSSYPYSDVILVKGQTSNNENQVVIDQEDIFIYKSNEQLVEPVKVEKPIEISNNDDEILNTDKTSKPVVNTKSYSDYLREGIENDREIFVNVGAYKYHLQNPKFEEDGSLTGRLIRNSDGVLEGEEITIKSYDIIENDSVKINPNEISRYRSKGITLDSPKDEFGNQTASFKRIRLDQSAAVFNKGDYDNIHFNAARRFFRASLICLAAIALVLIGAIFVVEIALIALGIFLVGFFFLMTAAIAMRRFYVKIGAAKFSKLNRARAIRTLIILALILFGCIPFFLPFLIFWLILRGGSKIKPVSYKS